MGTNQDKSEPTIHPITVVGKKKVMHNINDVSDREANPDFLQSNRPQRNNVRPFLDDNCVAEKEFGQQGIILGTKFQPPQFWKTMQASHNDL